MARNPDSESKTGERGKVSVVAGLNGEEAASVLRHLLNCHPELQAEAEAVAADVIGEISYLDVAEDVESAVLQFDWDDLNGCAGSHSGGYVEPGEAASELLEEAVEPFVGDMKRYLGIGLVKQARELCQGILLGLYRIRNNEGNGVLNYAPDFPEEAAGNALDEWSEASKAQGEIGPALSRDFIASCIPEWKWAAKTRSAASS